MHFQIPYPATTMIYYASTANQKAITSRIDFSDPLAPKKAMIVIESTLIERLHRVYCHL